MLALTATLTATPQSLDGIVRDSLTNVPATEIRLIAASIEAEITNTSDVQVLGTYGTTASGEHIAIAPGAEKTIPVSTAKDIRLAGDGQSVQVIIIQI